MRLTSQALLPIVSTFLLAIPLLAQPAVGEPACGANETPISDVRSDQWQGFWLGQSIGNWTGLVTEMDKIGGVGEQGSFYTREDWGMPDQPAIWSETPSDISSNIDFVLRGPSEIWGADDDTDIEYIYLWTLYHQQVTKLTPLQIREAWIRHIYDESLVDEVKSEFSGTVVSARDLDMF